MECRGFALRAAVAIVLTCCSAILIAPSATSLGAPAAARGSHAAWYVGTTSAGTRIDFRMSPSGLWVRDFHFGSPALPCTDGTSQTIVRDGNFPLTGLRVRHGTFHGLVHPEEYTASAPQGYQHEGTVSGRFTDVRHVTGTLTGGETRDCAVTSKLTFTATRVRSLPARPVRGGRYSGQTERGSNVAFQVSRSGLHVTSFRFARIWTTCTDNSRISYLVLAHGYPAVGLAQNRDGAFAGNLSSGLTADGRPAGVRVQVSVLFLSSREATGTVRLIGRTCSYETLPWRAALAR